MQPIDDDGFLPSERVGERCECQMLWSLAEIANVTVRVRGRVAGFACVEKSCLGDQIGRCMNFISALPWLIPLPKGG